MIKMLQHVNPFEIQKLKLMTSRIYRPFGKLIQFKLRYRKALTAQLKCRCRMQQIN